MIKRIQEERLLSEIYHTRSQDQASIFASFIFREIVIDFPWMALLSLGGVAAPMPRQPKTRELFLLFIRYLSKKCAHSRQLDENRGESTAKDHEHFFSHLLEQRAAAGDGDRSRRGPAAGICAGHPDAVENELLPFFTRVHLSPAAGDGDFGAAPGPGRPVSARVPDLAVRPGGTGRPPARPEGRQKNRAAQQRDVLQRRQLRHPAQPAGVPERSVHAVGTAF